MTVVDHRTGEIVEFDRAAAERRAERITLRLDAIAENYRMVLPMIREAIEKRDDIALGYRSPGDYVSDRFGQSLAGLGVEVRRAVVGELTQAGLSTRAIAPVVGVGASTVKRDAQEVAHVGHLNQTPAASSAGGTPARPESPKAALDEDGPTAAAATGPTDDSTAATPEGEKPASTRPPVVGRDGKTYQRSEPKPKKAKPRRALPDQFFDAAYDAVKRVESLHRLIGDDRFPQNAEKVAAKHRNDLLRIRDLLEQVISSLPEKESTND